MNHPFITRAGSLGTYIFILGFLLYLLHTGRLPARLFGQIVLALIVVDLVSQFSRDIPAKTQPEGAENTYVRSFWKRTPVLDYLRAQRAQEYFRTDDPSNLFPPNYGDTWRLEATMGHGATALVDYFAFRGTGWGPGSNASALLNVRFFPSRVPVPGMKKVFEDGDQAVYFNPRAVPRAFAVSSYRSVSSAQEILSWIQAPLFSLRETVILREEDVRVLPPEFLREVQDENEGITLGEMSWETAARKTADSLPDDQARHKLSVFGPAWGWSAGDELTFRFSPKRPLARSFVIVNFFPTTPHPSHLTLRLEGGSGPREIPVELSGLKDSEAEAWSPKQAAVDLGALESKEYQISLVKTAACSALIDSLRLARAPLSPAASPGDTVTITSFKPNRIRLEAELSRPSFVVISEVFFPGWEAWIDGGKAPLLAGDFILRAVPVPRGRHAIELRYRSKSLQWGLGISLLSLAGIVAFLVATRDRRSGIG